MEPTSVSIDPRYSADGIEATPWPRVINELGSTETYLFTTVLQDGTPHTVPITGIIDEDGFLFVTGPDEQKAVNLTRSPRASVQIGSGRFFEGMDIVMRGGVSPVTDQKTLEALVEKFVEKYGEFWRFGIGDGMLINHHGNPASVFRLTPQAVFSFTKGPDTVQTRYTFS